MNITGVRNRKYFERYRKLRMLFITKTSLRSTPLSLNYTSNTIYTLGLIYNAITSVDFMEYVNYSQLAQLDLNHNRITHLRPEAFVTPKLRIMNLRNNMIVTLGDVTQYPWGNALDEFQYLLIDLRGNHWNCNTSMNWMHNHLYNLQEKLFKEIIYAKPPLKPYVSRVNEMVCHSPSEYTGTTVVPPDVLAGINKTVRSLHDLAGRWSK